jgi:transcriptional regulator with PAS, ATPase and Fis domain
LFDSATTAVKLAEKLVYLESKLKFAQSELASLYATRYTFDDIIGDSLAMRSLKEEAISAAHNDLPVLITGESGTGKELFAQAIHRESARRAYPFVRVNCAAIPKELFESELFGYEKGAFSGAGPKGKAGKFELAHMGTIFLDEIGDMPLELQPKLLRVLELKEFERVGGNKLISSDFRVITATNQNLEQWMEFGRFRRDLYYRLNCIPLDIRPLRTRREDIACLADYLLQRIAGQGQGGKKSISPAAYKLMERYSWPGNGRELLHVLERTVFSMTGSTIAPPDLPDYLQLPMPSAPQIEKGTTLKAYLRTAEKFAIEHALAEANQNKTVAAKMLGIHRTLLYRKMQLLGLSHKINDA